VGVRAVEEDLLDVQSGDPLSDFLAHGGEPFRRDSHQVARNHDRGVQRLVAGAGFDGHDVRRQRGFRSTGDAQVELPVNSAASGLVEFDS
jgi:hypothetical protein